MDDASPFLQPCIDPNYRGTVGRYLIETAVGEGASCLVYKGWDPKLERVVAVRVLRPELAASEEAKAQFLAESRSGALVEHAHVLPLYEVGDAQGWPFTVVAFNDGLNLAEYLTQSATLPIQQVCRIALEITQALQALHDSHLVHYDLKPSNVLVSRDGENARLTDFGSSSNNAATPRYRSPEQIDGQDIDYRTDFFSFGVILYELIEGKAPYQADSTEALAKEITLAEAPEVTRSDCPDWLRHLVRKLLERSAKDRPTSAAVILQVLQTQQITSARSRRRLPSRLTIFGVLGLLLASLIALIIHIERAEPPIPTQPFISIEGEMGSYGDLAEAIENAPTGATLILSDGLHEVPDIVTISKPIHLKAAPDAHPFIRSQDTLKGRVFKVEAETTMEGLTLSHHVENPNVGGGLIRVFAPLTLIRCRVEVVWKNDAYLKSSKLKGISLEGSSLTMIQSEIEATSTKAIGVLTHESNPIVHLQLDECAIAAATAISFTGRAHEGQLKVSLSKCHVLASTAFVYTRPVGSIPHFEIENSVFDVDTMLYVSPNWSTFAANIFTDLTWEGRNNLYSFVRFLSARGEGVPAGELRRSIKGWLALCSSAREAGFEDAPDTIILPKLPEGYRDMRLTMQRLPRISAVDLRIQNPAMLEKYPDRGGDMSRVGPHSTATR